MANDDFSQANSLGSRSRRSIAVYLESIGDAEAAQRFRARGAAGAGIGAKIFGTDQYTHTGVLLGHIPLNGRGKLIAIDDAIGMKADQQLKNKRIKITLDKLFVQSFPGSGTHTVLCEFAGKNQIAGGAEEMRFALTTKVKDQASAAVIGAPIFLGASVGKDGIEFAGKTINVKSDDDDTLLEALESETIKNGLSLLTSAQPALKPFVGLATGVVKAVLGRSQNCQVHAFKLGLDFGSGRTSARLSLGSYVVVQADASTWNWASLGWDTNSQLVVERDSGNPIEFNYMVLGISEFEGDK